MLRVEFTIHNLQDVMRIIKELKNDVHIGRLNLTAETTEKEPKLYNDKSFCPPGSQGNPFTAAFNYTPYLYPLKSSSQGRSGEMPSYELVI